LALSVGAKPGCALTATIWLLRSRRRREAAHEHDARVRRLAQERQQHAGQRERPKIVGREVQLVARLVSRQRHAVHARVVDHQIELPHPLADQRAELVDRLGPRHVERQHRDLGVAVFFE